MSKVALSVSTTAVGVSLLAGVALSTGWVLIAGATDVTILANLATAQASALLAGLVGRLGVENRFLKTAVRSFPEAVKLLGFAVVGSLLAAAGGLVVLTFVLWGLFAPYPWAAIGSGLMSAPFATMWILGVEFQKSQNRPLRASVTNSVVVPLVLSLSCVVFFFALDLGYADRDSSIWFLICVPLSYSAGALFGGAPKLLSSDLLIESLSISGAFGYLAHTGHFFITSLANQMFTGSVLAISSFFLAETALAGLAVALRFALLPALSLVIVGYLLVPRLLAVPEGQIAAVHRQRMVMSAALGLPTAACVLILTWWRPFGSESILPSFALTLILVAGQVVALSFGPVGMALVALGAEKNLALLSVCSIAILLACLPVFAYYLSAAGVAILVSGIVSLQNILAFGLYKHRLRQNSQGKLPKVVSAN